MFESLEDLDFSEGSDGYSLLLIVHENPLEGNYLSCSFLDRFMNLTGKRLGWRRGVKAKLLPKCSFSQLGRNVIIVN